MVMIRLQRPHRQRRGITAGIGNVLPLRWGVLLILILCWKGALAQPAEPVPDETMETVERMIQGREEELSDDQDLIDELEGYRRRPLNLYTTTPDSLARLPGISIQDAHVILAFVDTASPAQIQELDSIGRLDAGQLQILRAYASLRHPRLPPLPQRLDLSLRGRFHQDLQPRRGYTAPLLRTIPRRDAAGDSLGLDTIAIGTPYLGGRAGILTRILAAYGEFSGGITFERDPGEPFLATDTPSLSYARYEYFDPAGGAIAGGSRFGAFLSAHASARLGPLTLHLGDYSAEFGQGLLFGSSFGGRKGGEVIESPYTSARGIASYTSAAESGFYRGAAVGFDPGGGLPGSFAASLFWSRRSLDASLEETSDGSGSAIVRIGTIREDGYRRTWSELRRSGNLDETLIGGNIRVNVRGGRIGLTAYTSRFSIPATPSLAAGHAGEPATMMSIDWSYARWGIFFFGEVARATDGTLGAVSGISSSIGNVDLMLAGRYLPPSFSTPHGSGFGEAPARQHNERGIYIAAKAPLMKGLSLSAYFDYYNVPERTALVPFPRTGADGYLQFDYNPSPSVRLYGRIRSETKGTALTVADSLGRERRKMLERTSTSGRLSAEYLTRGGAIRLRARIERRFTGYNDEVASSDGVLTFVDLRLRPIPALAIGARMALFDTDDFDAAIYQFEQEVPGKLTNLPLSGEGRRFYLYATWSPSRALSFALKYAETVYADRQIISPGTLQQITAPINNSLAIQVEVRM